MDGWMDGWMDVRMYVRMYVSECVRVYVYVCMYVRMYMYVICVTAADPHGFQEEMPALCIRCNSTEARELTSWQSSRLLYNSACSSVELIACGWKRALNRKKQL